MRKLVILALLSGLAVTMSLATDPSDLKAGKHKGEVKQLEVDIAFSEEFGVTVTDEVGTWYKFWGMTFYENKVYIPEYQGTYPLYFFGTPVGVTVTIKNNGPRQRTKLTITTEAYCLRPDGSSGSELCSPSSIDVVIEKGETKTIDASFMTQWTGAEESGLDRFLVKVAHTNKGGGPGNSDPALIMVKEGIFCPPEVEDAAHKAFEEDE